MFLSPDISDQAGEAQDQMDTEGTGLRGALGKATVTGVI